MKEIWLTPSDLSFAIPECPRCWWLKRVARITKPFGDFPQMFRQIDSLIKQAFQDADLSDWGIPGRIVDFSKKVYGAPREYPKLGIRLVTMGEYDTLVKHDDGSFGVWDFKTTVPKEERIREYKAAMSLYAWMLENPDRGREPREVMSAGLLAFNPEMMATVDRRAVLQGEVHRLDVPIEFDFLEEQCLAAATIAAMPKPPLRGADCPQCTYFNRVAKYAKEHQEGEPPKEQSA